MLYLYVLACFEETLIWGFLHNGGREAKRFRIASLRLLGSLCEGEPAPQLIGKMRIALAQRGQNVTGPNALQEKLP